MKATVLKSTILFIILTTFWAILLPSASAQTQDINWTNPYKLSTEHAVKVRLRSNTVLRDQRGYIHAFWIEVPVPDEPWTIVYSRFDGRSWTTPVDIYAAQPGIQIDTLSAVADNFSNLHLIWTEGFGFRDTLYYTRANVADALSSQGWSLPDQVRAGIHLSSLAVDSAGGLHVLYSQFYEPEPGVYYTHASQQELSWSRPVRIDPDIPEGYWANSLQLKLDRDDGLHAAWDYTSRKAFEAHSVRYARSIDQGASWSKPFTIDQTEGPIVRLRQPGPVLAVQGQTVHLIWAAAEVNAGPAAARLLYRYHRYSTDRGRSWTAPVRIFGDLNGQAFDGLTVDSSGRLHFFAQVRYPQGIYHGYWERERWVGPTLIYLISADANDPIGDRIHAHSVHPVVGQGNQLVVTFMSAPSDEQGALYAMHTPLDNLAPLPLLQPRPPVARSTPVAESGLLYRPPSGNAQPRISPTAPPAPLAFDDAEHETLEVSTESSYGVGVQRAILATLGVILIAVLYRVARSRSSSGQR